LRQIELHFQPVLVRNLRMHKPASCASSPCWAAEALQFTQDRSYAQSCELQEQGTHLLQQHVHVLLWRAQAGLVVHSALYKLTLHVQVLELALELVHCGRNLLQVVACQRLRSWTFSFVSACDFAANIYNPASVD
jgi:hypothetical protein